jgi:hypothetical protein
LGVENLKVAKGINFQLGGGKNTVTAALTGVTTKSFQITGNSGDSNVAISADGSLGATVLHLGSGNNSCSITGADELLNIASIDYSSTAGAADAAALILAQVQVAGKVNATFGDSGSTLQADASFFGGAVTATAGNGADSILFASQDSASPTFFKGAVSITLGNGGNTVDLGGADPTEQVAALSTFVVNGGTGVNSLSNPVTNVFAKKPVFTHFP